ncbi:hypothetical protein ABGB17_17870 [Sphaerisporangium sp. B11E5]|uniref:hypothetical protein n=1 Tax=Sphaerisporangium sp. B11E5 TaxID=3153563 RepID=UPI00325E89E5
MEFIKVERRSQIYGFSLDPRPYLLELPRLRAELPQGAWAFASDPEHYDFSSTRCVKDLSVGKICLADDGRLALDIDLEPNRWKHDAGLKLRYADVTKLVVDHAARGPEPKMLGNLLLDEIVPAPQGCSHELIFTGGSVLIVCADLEAVWKG